MATPSNRPPQIHPSLRVVMRLPQTDVTKDPWTGAPISSGRNFADPSAIDENVSLAPPEGKSSAELLHELEGPHGVEQLVESSGPPVKLQFSLAELMLLTAIAGVGLAGARLLPAGPFACLVGAMAFISMWLTDHWRIRQRWVRFGVWSLLLVYIIAAAVAIVRT